MLDPYRFLKPLLVLLGMVCLPSVVFAINLNGSWSYRESGSDTSETFREIRQNYSFGVGPALTYSPSHAIKANASVGYTQTNGVSEQGSSTGRTITPTAGFRLVNDLFSFGLSGNTSNSQSNGGDWSTNTSWNANLSSSWDAPYIPTVFLSYGAYGAESDGGAFASAKTQSNTLNVGVDWDLQRSEVSYRYSNASGDNLPTSQSHFVRMKTSGKFWDDRVLVSLSQQAQFDSVEFDEGVQGGTADNQVIGTVLGAFATDDNPVGYSDGASRIDGDDWLSAGVPDASPDSIVNKQIVLAFRGAFSDRRVEKVIISFDENAPPTEFSDVSDSQWDLYVYQSGSDDWELVEENLDGDFDSEERELSILIPETTRDFLLVSNSLNSPNVTNFEVFEIFTVGTERASRNYQTNAGVNVRFSDTLSSSLGLTYVRDESETKGDDGDDFDSDKITTSANLSWRPASFLRTSIGASEHRERKLGEEQVLNRNYSFSLGTNPLPTVNVNFGVQLNERYGVELESGAIDIDQKTLETTRYSVTSKAQIYPDLSASFNLSYTEGKRWLKDEDADTGRFADESGYNGRIDLNAKLYKNLTADLSGRYGQTENDGVRSKSGSAELGIRYRISDLLLVRGRYNKDLVRNDAPASINLRLLATVIDTHKTSLDLSVAHSQAEETLERISLNGSWLVSKNMSVTGRGGYNFGETNSYNLTLDLRIGI